MHNCILNGVHGRGCIGCQGIISHTRDTPLMKLEFAYIMVDSGGIACNRRLVGTFHHWLSAFRLPTRRRAARVCISKNMLKKRVLVLSEIPHSPRIAADCHCRLLQRQAKLLLVLGRWPARRGRARAHTTRGRARAHTNRCCWSHGRLHILKLSAPFMCEIPPARRSRQTAITGCRGLRLTGSDMCSWVRLPPPTSAMGSRPAGAKQDEDAAGRMAAANS